MLVQDQTNWKLSRYTSVVDLGSGDLLLHQSYMGGVVWVAAENAHLIYSLIKERDNNNELDRRIHGPSGYEYLNRNDALPENILPNRQEKSVLNQLFQTGFLIPEDLPEEEIVRQSIQQERERGFHLIVLPHENCNFRCDYCYETFERGKMKKEIVQGLKTFINEKIPKIESLSVSWFGGEPLLARKIIYDLSDSFIERCQRVGISYKSSITTNAYLLKPEVAKALLKREVRNYQITLDGAEEFHNKSRKLAGGGGTYQEIIKNLYAMKQIDEEYSVRLRVNFTPANNHSIPSLIEDIKPLLLNDQRFYLAFHPVGKWGGPNDQSLEVCDAKSAETIKLDYMHKTMNLGSSARVAREGLSPHGKVCYAGRASSIVVGSDGKVYKCTVAFEDPRNQVGRLTDKGKLLVNEKRWKLWTSLDGQNTTKCQSCAFHPVCQSKSCPLTAMDYQEPQCPMSEEEYAAMVQLSALAG